VPDVIEVRVEMAEECLHIDIPYPDHIQVRFPYPGPAADSAAVFGEVFPGFAVGWGLLGTVAGEGSQAVVVQQGFAVVGLLDLADPGHIAIHSMVSVVLVAPAVVGVVVTLRFPMFRSICSMF
jgi:hypothetical protein